MVALAVANSAGLPDSAQKTALSFVELILAHRARQKTRPSLGVGLAPHAANEFTRGGFLDCAQQANPLPSWLHHRCLRIGVAVSRITNLGESPNLIESARVRDHSPANFWPNRQRCPDRYAFKKTCPFEFTRHGRPQVDTESRPSFLPRSVSQCEFQ